MQALQFESPHRVQKLKESDANPLTGTIIPAGKLSLCYTEQLPLYLDEHSEGFRMLCSFLAAKAVDVGHVPSDNPVFRFRGYEYQNQHY
jgi:hypothetical protein